jgi:hypothetical protein
MVTTMPQVGDVVDFYQNGVESQQFPAFVLKTSGGAWPVLLLGLIGSHTGHIAATVRHDEDPWFKTYPAARSTNGFFRQHVTCVEKELMSKLGALERLVDGLTK